MKAEDLPVLHARLQVQVGVDRPQPLDHMDTQPLEHLPHPPNRTLAVCVCVCVCENECVSL